MSALGRIARYLRIAAAAGLVAMMLTTAIDISMRLLLNELILGSVEVVSLMLIAVVFLAIPETFLRNEQITVDAIDLLVSRKARQILQFGASVLTLVMLSVMFAFMLPMAIDTLVIGDRTTDLQFSLFWYWLPVLAGVLGGALAMFPVVLGAWRAIGSGDERAGEAFHAD